MRYVILVLIASIVLAAMATPVEDMRRCDNSREAVEECAGFLFDANHDGQITPEEIDAAIPQLVGMPAEGMNSTFVMRCDMDEDGVLTHEDWIFTNGTQCLPTPNLLFIACTVCIRNGFEMNHEEARKKRGVDAYDYDAVIRVALENAEKLREAEKRRKEENIKMAREYLAARKKQQSDKAEDPKKFGDDAKRIEERGDKQPVTESRLQ